MYIHSGDKKVVWVQGRDCAVSPSDSGTSIMSTVGRETDSRADSSSVLFSIYDTMQWSRVWKILLLQKVLYICTHNQSKVELHNMITFLPKPKKEPSCRALAIHCTHYIHTHTHIHTHTNIHTHTHTMWHLSLTLTCNCWSHKACIVRI